MSEYPDIQEMDSFYTQVGVQPQQGAGIINPTAPIAIADTSGASMAQANQNALATYDAQSRGSQAVAKARMEQNTGMIGAALNQNKNVSAAELSSNAAIGKAELDASSSAIQSMQSIAQSAGGGSRLADELNGLIAVANQFTQGEQNKKELEAKFKQMNIQEEVNYNERLDRAAKEQKALEEEAARQLAAQQKAAAGQAEAAATSEVEQLKLRVRNLGQNAAQLEFEQLMEKYPDLQYDTDAIKRLTSSFYGTAQTVKEERDKALINRVDKDSATRLDMFVSDSRTAAADILSGIKNSRNGNDANDYLNKFYKLVNDRAALAEQQGLDPYQITELRASLLKQVAENFTGNAEARGVIYSRMQRDNEYFANASTLRNLVGLPKEQGGITQSEYEFQLTQAARNLDVAPYIPGTASDDFLTNNKIATAEEQQQQRLIKQGIDQNQGNLTREGMGRLVFDASNDDRLLAQLENDPKLSQLPTIKEAITGAKAYRKWTRDDLPAMRLKYTNAVEEVQKQRTLLSTGMGSQEQVDAAVATVQEIANQITLGNQAFNSYYLQGGEASLTQAEGGTPGQTGNILGALRGNFNSPSGSSSAGLQSTSLPPKGVINTSAKPSVVSSMPRAKNGVPAFSTQGGTTLMVFGKYNESRPGHKHAGLDLGHVDQDVSFPTTGTVEFIGYQAGRPKKPGYGHYVDIRTGDGAVHRFAHLGGIYNKVGDNIDPSKPFAKSGNSGGVVKHLHYEVRKHSGAEGGVAFTMNDTLDPNDYWSRAPLLPGTANNSTMATSESEAPIQIAIAPEPKFITPKPSDLKLPEGSKVVNFGTKTAYYWTPNDLKESLPGAIPLRKEGTAYNYQYKQDTTPKKTIGAGITVIPATANAYAAMIKDAKAEGVVLRAIPVVSKAPKGYNESATGRVVNFNSTNPKFKTTPEYAWLAKNAGKYGFRQTYGTGAKGAEAPWHWAFVGKEAPRSEPLPEGQLTAGSPGGMKLESASTGTGRKVQTLDGYMVPLPNGNVVNRGTLYRPLEGGGYEELTKPIYTRQNPVAPTYSASSTSDYKGGGQYNSFQFDSSTGATTNTNWGFNVFNKDKAFHRRTIEVSKDIGIPPAWLASLMNYECAFKQNEINQYGCVGLIQFCPGGGLSDSGLTAGQMAALSRADQMKYVNKYLAPYKGKIKTLEDLVIAVFRPALWGKSKAEKAAFRDGNGVNVFDYIQRVNQFLPANMKYRANNIQARASNHVHEHFVEGCPQCNEYQIAESFVPHLVT